MCSTCACAQETLDYAPILQKETWSSLERSLFQKEIFPIFQIIAASQNYISFSSCIFSLMQEESKKKKAVKKISEISVDSRLWDDKVWRVEGGERRKEKWKEEARKGTIKKHSTGFFESEEIELERFRRKRRPCAERILEIAWTTTTWSKTSLLFLVKPNVENVLLIDHRAVTR